MNRFHILALAVVVLCVVIAASAQNRHFGFPSPVRIDGKYGFMSSNCQIVIPIQYAEALDFTEGLAAVKIGPRWGYINESGAVVIPAQFARAWHFSDGLASVKLDERSPLWGFVDKRGQVVIRPQFGMPLWFSEGLVEGYGEKDHILNVPLGYVDQTGKYAVHLNEPGMEIEFLVGFSEGLARVSMYKKHPDGTAGPITWGYIDHSGRWGIPRSFTVADDFHEGLAAATSKDGTWGYIDKTGQFVIAPRFEAAMEFSEGLAAVKIGGVWGWINKSGAVVIAPRFEEEEVGVFRSGMAMLVHNRKLGYINMKGELVIPQTLDGGTEFMGGVAMVPDGSGYAVINDSGKVTCRLSGHSVDH